MRFDSNILRLKMCLVGAVLLALFALGIGYPAAADERGTAMALIDFSAGSPVWVSIDDAVMGGVSASEMVIEDGIAVFRGRVSLDNNGGFASVRSRPKDIDLSDFEGITLRVRGDGNRYAFRIRTNANFDGVSYQVTLSPDAGVWQEIFLPFCDFEPVFRGRLVEGHPPIEPSEIKTFGLLIAGRQEGTFRIDIAWIRGELENRK